ncbi:hypothetical protein LNQ81_00150 [Myroides sp. M-43]|uniref:hypothetical protein n=1 Tax=Myroides oncorhynchi TaxID=2893756 RepID=UPI001E3647C0|nr:hypothetical protein [Myroides oncorhynchi]MCC9041150.1 hypothetical protein [Myroides oncorhynchi]
MKKKVITIGVLMMSGFVFSQVGIGTRAPHRSALLELKADAGEYRGVLIPRIPLRDLNDKSFINKGDVATSLLIFNTTDNAVLAPGFYYWKAKEWVRVIDSKDVIDNLDNFPRNSVLGVVDDKLVLEDTKGGKVETPIKDLNIVTTIKEIDKGKYVYTNEAGVTQVIDVTGSVINNITEILKDEKVVEQIYTSVAAKGKAATTADGSIKIDNGAKAVLHPMQLSVAERGITPKKMAPGANGSFLITTNSGTVKWVSATDESIKEILSLNQAITLLQDNNDGTLTYYNESCFDKEGKFIAGSVGQKFDSNTLRIDATTDGKYKFYDGRSKDTPVAIIDVKGTVIENITEILENNTVKQQIYQTVAAQGKKVSGDEAIAIKDGEKAVLTEMTISLKDKGINIGKLKPGGNKQILVTDKNGNVQWVAANDEVIKEAIKFNERVTVLENHHNGTFTYYNEHGVDEQGNVITGKGIYFDANTLRIEERKGAKGKGVYDFYDGMKTKEKADPLMTINTRASAIVYENNSTIIQGDNLQDVVNNIIAKVEIAQGAPQAVKGDGILINDNAILAGAVLKEMLLSIADNAISTDKIVDGAVTSYKLKDKAVTTAKIEPGAEKHILVTKNGEVKWVPSTDEIIKEVVKTNEVVTLIVNNNNGTYSYYNEKSIDTNGQPIDAKGVLIDANTLNITDDTKGKYIFSDGTGVIATIDIKATILTNIDQILNNTTVQDTIYTTVAAKGQKLEAEDTSIHIDAGDKAVLNNTKISVANQGITTAKIKPGIDKYLLVTKDGEVKWVPASDSIITEVIDSNETVTLLTVNPNGTFTYQNEKNIKEATAGVEFDANTLKIQEKAGAKGVYIFYDGKTTLAAPLMTIDIAGTVIENIKEILNDTTVQNDIYTTVAAQAQAVTSAKGSIELVGADKAVLNQMQLDIAKDGVTTEMIKDKTVTPGKLAPGTKVGQLLVTNVNKQAQWVDATDQVIKDFLKGNQAITVIKDLGNGKFTYFNEDCFDADGTPNGQPGITFDANTLRIDTEKVNNKQTGKYTFYDKTSTTALATINVSEDVINNITGILNNEDVKNQIFNTVASKGKKVESTDGSMAITGGDKAALSQLTINIKEGGVTTTKISSQGADQGSVLTADGLGKVDFKTPTESVAPAMKGDLVGEDTVIKIDGGKDVLFGVDGKETKISINTGGITSKHIQNETIQNDDIANKTITATKLSADTAIEGAVATAQADGTVVYSPLLASNIANKADIKVEDGIAVDNGTGKVLADVTLSLNDKGVSPTKLTPGIDKYLLVTKAGKAEWVEAKDDIIKDAISSNETVTVLKNLGKGIYTYFNEDAVKNNTTGVNIDVNSLSIDSSKPGVYVFKDLSSDNPLATIDIASDVINSIVTILGDNNVKLEIYKIVAAQGKAITSTDGSLSIPVGNKAGLADLNIEIAKDGVTTDHIADRQVTAAKLVADSITQEGFVATVNADGTVSYKSLTSTDVSGKAAALKTDNIIQVDGGNSKAGVLFSEATLSIKNKAIGTDQLADGAVTTAQIEDHAVTTNKISSEGVGEKRILVSGPGNTVVWKEMGDFEEISSGDLTTDNIITMSTNGKGTILKDIKLGIADKSITKAKLSSEDDSNIGTNILKDRILVTDGNGGFDYVSKDAVLMGGKDLFVGNALEFTQGNGKSTVLVETNINVKDKGITPAKISSTGADKNTVLTADGQGNVAYEKLSETAFDGKGAELKSEGSLNIAAGNQAVLKETTIDIAEKGVQTKHIADENVTVDKLKAGVAKQLLITNAGGKAQWVDGSDTIIKDIVATHEKITVLTDNQDGTFTYQNEADITNGTPGIRFSANTLTITDNGKGKYVFTDKSGNGDLATIDIQATIISNITELLKDINVKQEIYNVVATQGKKVSEGDAIAIEGGEKAALSEMTISLKDKGVTTAKLSSIGASNNTVLTANGNGDVAYKPLSTGAFAGSEAELKTDGSLNIPLNNKAVLKETTIGIADLGVKTKHIAAKVVTVDKIGTNEPEGKVLTSNGEGGAAFKTLKEVVAEQGKAIKGDSAIKVEGGTQAALTEVMLTLNDASITNSKLATDAVSKDKIQDKAITASKMMGEQARTILITDAIGNVRWADANENVIKDMVNHAESLTLLRDNTDGTFTYFNEDQVDNKGNVVSGAKGITFDANTLMVDTKTPGVYVLKDKSAKENLAVIDTRASHIIFEGDNIEYNNVEEAIVSITKKIEQLEKVEIQKAPLSGKGILVDGKASVADVVFKAVELSIADNAITTSKIADENVSVQKIKAGKAKQLLVTNITGKTEWVDASSDIIKDIVQTQERVTILEDNQDGTFTYFSEKDLDKDGNRIGDGVTFNANTLKIEVIGKGKYEFYDKSQGAPLATIDVASDVIENILEIIKDINVKEEIYNTIAAQGKKVSAGDAIAITGGDQAALNEMTISLKDEGVSSEKIKGHAVTEDKLFAAENKKDFVPVVQVDGTVKYQPISTVVTGQMLTTDNSLTATGNVSKALLQELDLKVSSLGIGNEHIQSLSVTTDKISSKIKDGVAIKGDVLTADGVGNTVFYSAKEIVNSATQADLVGETGVIVVKEGENVLFGDATKKTTIQINKGGIKGGTNGHIAAGTIQDLNIANQSITVGKLTGADAIEGTVATVGKNGTVSYQPISPNVITNKGTVSVTDGLTLSENGIDKVLADFSIGIEDTSISITKLDGGGAVAGSVATVGANGQSVSYQPISTTTLANKGTLSTDGVILVDNGVDKLLENTKLSIAEGGISNKHLAGKAVTVDKMSSVGVGEKRVLISGANDEVKWGELGDIVTNTAGNLTTDGIVVLEQGTGVNTLLADAKLGIAANSITSDKLSSKKDNLPVAIDYILVTDGQGGFDYVEKEAVQAGGVDLNVGTALEFTNGTTGKNAVLAPTSLDVKDKGIGTGKLTDGAVTVDKISSGTAAANTVLTSLGQGKVSYKALSNTAFEGQGVDLKSDSSIKVLAGNKALLKETSIEIAEAGIEAKHIKEKAVTPDKINSVNGKDNFTEGTFLAADGKGATTYQTIDKIALTQGKEVTSGDKSIAVTAGNKAALQNLDIALAKGGVKNEHIGARQVTVDKIGSGDTAQGYLLTTNGQGGAEFKDVGQAMSEIGKPLVGGTGITVTGAGKEHALLGDATINIAEKGVGELQLADNSVTMSKIASKNVSVDKLSGKEKDKNVDKGKVLTSDGQGGVIFESPAGATTTGELKGSVSINVNNGKGALLHEADITVKASGINTVHLANGAVTNEKIADGTITTEKIGKEAIKNGQIAKSAVGRDQIYIQNIDEKHFSTGAVSTRALAKDAVATEKISDAAVTTAKMNAVGSTIGHVLTVESGGKVAFKAPTGSSITKKNITESATIKATKGATGSVLEEVQLEIMNNSITGDHIKYNTVGYKNMQSKAVGHNELRDDAVSGRVVEDKGIGEEKISSGTTDEGYVLTSDGQGGAEFREIKAGNAKAAMPKFFYAPAFYITVEPGEKGSVDVYEYYAQQFGAPKAINSSAQRKTLPVLDYDELDYYVLYYDEQVFKNVEITDGGDLKYEVKNDAQVSTNTYFNIVFGVRE